MQTDSLLLLAAVFVAPFAPTCRGEVGLRDCDWLMPRLRSCCRVTPNCSGPIRLQCDFSTCSWTSIIFDEMVVRRASSIHVSNGRRLTFYMGAPDSNVHEITLKNITDLRVAGRQPPAGPASANVSLSIQDVSNLTIDSRAFSSWSSEQSSVSIKKIDKCTIRSGAFPQGSVIGKVHLMNVKLLQADERAFDTNIESLVLQNVTLNVCKYQTFRGQINDMALLSSHVGTFLHRCIDASAGWSRLTIRSCQLGTFEPFAIGGSILDLRLDNSRIGLVDRFGMFLNVTRFAVMSSSFGQLRRCSLNVEAGESIMIRNSKVTKLREHALQKLRLRNNISAKTLALSGIIIGRAYHSSLSLDDTVAKVCLSELLFREPCRCPITTRAASLIGAPTAQSTPSGPISITQLLSNCRCQGVDAAYPTMAEYSLQHCNQSYPDAAAAEGGFNASCPVFGPADTPFSYSRQYSVESGSGNARYTYVLIVAAVSLLVAVAVYGGYKLGILSRGENVPPHGNDVGGPTGKEDTELEMRSRKDAPSARDSGHEQHLYEEIVSLGAGCSTASDNDTSVDSYVLMSKDGYLVPDNMFKSGSRVQLIY